MRFTKITTAVSENEMFEFLGPIVPEERILYKFLAICSIHRYTEGLLRKSPTDSPKYLKSCLAVEYLSFVLLKYLDVNRQFSPTPEVGAKSRRMRRIYFYAIGK